MTTPPPSPDPSRPPAVHIMRCLGLEPDPWQAEVLEGRHPRLLLNCCRQAGKSTAVALLALAEAVWCPFTQVLLLSRSYRQAHELFRIVSRHLHRLKPDLVERSSDGELELKNYSRVVCLPCKEETIRGYSKVNLLVIDEAARVPDDLYRAVSPMLAVSGGRMVCLSTPYGRRGFFWESWAKGGSDWHRIEVPASQVSRIPPEFLERERRLLGESWFRQEYCCSFEAVAGLVYPDFGRCVVSGPAPEGKKVGGIDFGLRNPFAAVWGVHDRDNVLWLTGEHFDREKSLAFHADHLPKDVQWYADPSGSREMRELRGFGVKAIPGDNEVRPGIAAVRARLEVDALRVVSGRCPNLLAEAALYRWDPEAGRHSEVPLKEHDHALDALRYLVSMIDKYRMARLKKGKPAVEEPAEPKPARQDPPPPPKRDRWLRFDNEELWTRLL